MANEERGRTSRCRPASALLFLMLVVAPAVAADGGDGEVPINPAFAVTFGLGGYTVEGRSVQVYEIPVSFPLLRPGEDRSWGLALTTPVSFGVHALSADSTEESLSARVRTVALSPGLELDLPLPRGWTLRPFAEVGYVAGWSGGRNYWTWGVGARAGVDLPWERVATRFGGSIQVAGSEGLPDGVSDHFTLLELGVETVFPGGLDAGDRTLDLGTYAIGRSYRGLEFSVPDADPVSIGLQGEVGLTVGGDPPLRLFGFDLGRLGLGYRFGSGLEGIRLSFGFPF